MITGSSIHRVRYIPGTNRYENDSQGDFVTCAYLDFGDYGGGMVERSNQKVFRETFEDSEGTLWWHVTTGYGGNVIIIRRDADEENAEIGEFIDGLESYPSADDDNLSQMELEQSDSDWESYGLADFKKAVEKQIDDDAIFELLDLNETQWRQLFNDVCEGANVNGGPGYVIETGGNTHFYVDEAAKAFVRKDAHLVVIDEVVGKKKLPADLWRLFRR